MKSGLTQSLCTEHLLALLQHKARHSGGKELEKAATRDCSLPRLLLSPAAGPLFWLQSSSRQKPGPVRTSTVRLPEISIPWQTCLSWIYFSHIWKAGLSLLLQMEHPTNRVREQVFFLR